MAKPFNIGHFSDHYVDVSFIPEVNLFIGLSFVNLVCCTGHSAGVIVGTGLGGVVVGLLGQWGYFRFNHWRKKKAILHHYPDLAPPKREKWTLVSRSMLARCQWALL